MSNKKQRLGKLSNLSCLLLQLCSVQAKFLILDLVAIPKTENY